MQIPGPSPGAAKSESGPAMEESQRVCTLTQSSSPWWVGMRESFPVNEMMEVRQKEWLRGDGKRKGMSDMETRMCKGTEVGRSLRCLWIGSSGGWRVVGMEEGV